MGQEEDGHPRKISSQADFFNISNDTGRVKSLLFWFFSSFKYTPTSAQARSLTGREFRRDRRSLASMSNLVTRPVLIHRLGVAHQTSLRSLWTMMIYSNSPRLGEAGNLISLPVTALQDHC